MSDLEHIGPAVQRVWRVIETAYAGYRFRSRLEARWAVFLDCLAIPYSYEAEGFALSVGWYLPDFYLPTLHHWLEIKPHPTGRCYAENGGFADDLWVTDPKVTAFAEETQAEIILLAGDPYPGRYEAFPHGDNHYLWCECCYCGLVRLQYEGRSARNCECQKNGPNHPDKGYNSESPRLCQAFELASSARFTSASRYPPLAVTPSKMVPLPVTAVPSYLVPRRIRATQDCACRTCGYGIGETDECWIRLGDFDLSHFCSTACAMAYDPNRDSDGTNLPF